MEHESLIDIILNAPAWACVGLTVPNADLRERAASELASAILAGLNPMPEPDRNQIPLPL